MSIAKFRAVPAGQSSPDAVTVGIERAPKGDIKAAAWWEARGDVDADEAEYDDVPRALAATDGAKGGGTSSA